MKKKVILIGLIFISCEGLNVKNSNGTQQETTRNDESAGIVNQYEGAIQTLYDYIDVFHKNEITDENFSLIFNSPFVFSSIENPNMTFNTISETTGFYNVIRNVVYPDISSPYEFEYFRLDKLKLFPLSEKSVMLSIRYVWHTTPEQTPRFKEAFTYLLKYDDIQKKWLMNNLIEIHYDYYPENWIDVEIAPEWKYNNKISLDQLQGLTAPKL